MSPRPRSNSTSNVPPAGWGRGRKCAVTVLVLGHLLAVFTAPFMFAASGVEASSPFAGSLMQTLRPYIDFAYLNHGYFFFAPNPGPSHLLRCRLEYADGRVEERWFPDRQRDFPRLLYHRHFMLAEQLHAMFTPDLTAEEQRELGEIDEWRRQRETYLLRRAAFEAHLREHYGAERVTLVRVEHRIFSPAEKVRGMPLSDPSLFEDLPEQLPASSAAGEGP